MAIPLNNIKHKQNLQICHKKTTETEKISKKNISFVAIETQ